MKNILFIHYGGGSIRGSEMCFLSILSLINRSIFAPLVICNQEIMAEKVRAINIPVFRMKIPEITLDGKNSRFQIFLYFQTLYRIAQIIKKNKIDLIYSNSGLPSQMGFPLSKIFNIPLLCHIHARHPKRYAWMWLFKFSNKVIFVSDFVKNDLEKKVKFNGKVRVVYNGVDTEKRFNRNLNLDPNLKRSMGFLNGDVVVGQVGSLVNYKGVDLLIKAVNILYKNFPFVKLLIIGDGKEKENLNNLAKNLRVSDRVVFLGNVDNPEFYLSNVMDIHVLASKSEGLGLSLIEAASCGLPNVATRIGGIPEIVEDGVTGFLFEKDNVEELAKKISFLIENPLIRKEMGEAARLKVEKEFSLDVYIKKLETEISLLM